MKSGEHKRLLYDNGRYFVDPGITVQEWKEMLLNKDIFYKEAKEMILLWYYQEDHLASSKNICIQQNISPKGTPYNGTVQGLSRRILNHLNNRFWIESSDGKGKISYWSIPFNGWHEDYNPSQNFVWQLRDELVQAIDETPEFLDSQLKPEEISISENSDSLASVVYEPEKEGAARKYYVTKYERKRKNRDLVIRLTKQRYGRLCCEVCGFDFEKTYGEIGKDFIEVHHNKPLYSLEEETVPNPETDFNCLCSNCHRMIHRRAGDILTVKELKKMIHKNSNLK